MADETPEGRVTPGRENKVTPGRENEVTPGPEPTHDLLLPGGRVVASSGAVPTHYAEGDRVYPVIRVFER